MPRQRSGEWYQKMSAALKVSKNTVASIILKWKTFGTIKTLPRAYRLAKLSNWGRRVLVMEVNTLTELQSSSVEIFPEGQPSLQHSTTQAFIVEWPDGNHSSVKAQHTWDLLKGT